MIDLTELGQYEHSRGVPIVYMFKPDHPAEQIQSFIQLCQKNRWPMRYWHNPESNLMLLAVLCEDEGEDTGTELYDAINNAGITFESIGVASVQELGAAKTIPQNWDVEIRNETVVITCDGKFLIFSSEGAYLW